MSRNLACSLALLLCAVAPPSAHAWGDWGGWFKETIVAPVKEAVVEPVKNEVQNVVADLQETNYIDAVKNAAGQAKGHVENAVGGIWDKLPTLEEAKGHMADAIADSSFMEQVAGHCQSYSVNITAAIPNVAPLIVKAFQAMPDDPGLFPKECEATLSDKLLEYFMKELGDNFGDEIKKRVYTLLIENAAAQLCELPNGLQATLKEFTSTRKANPDVYAAQIQQALTEQLQTYLPADLSCLCSGIATSVNVCPTPIGAEFQTFNSKILPSSIGATSVVGAAFLAVALGSMVFAMRVLRRQSQVRAQDFGLVDTKDDMEDGSAE